MMFDAQPWLARLSFTFFIIGGLLLWQAYKSRAQVPPPPQWLMAMYAVGAALSFVLGLAGVRARHRMWNGQRRDHHDR